MIPSILARDEATALEALVDLGRRPASFIGKRGAEREVELARALALRLLSLVASCGLERLEVQLGVGFQTVCRRLIEDRSELVQVGLSRAGALLSGLGLDLAAGHGAGIGSADGHSFAHEAGLKRPGVLLGPPLSKVTQCTGVAGF